jgi:hypothetical protein
MSGFQVGDVVVCVDDKSRPGFDRCRLCRNATYRVEKVGLGPISGDPCLMVSQDDYVWHPLWRFRKIRPASDEFIASLRACKPQHAKVPA